MESSLFILLKGGVDLVDKTTEFLSDDAPLFDDEVEPKWRRLFNCIEDINPPEDRVRLADDLVLLTWVVGYWDDELDELAPLLLKAGFKQMCVYGEYDDEEIFLRSSGGKCKRFNADLVSQSQLSQSFSACYRDALFEYDLESKVVIATLIDNI